MTAKQFIQSTLKQIQDSLYENISMDAGSEVIFQDLPTLEFEKLYGKQTSLIIRVIKKGE